jgi:hypothetical protein
VKSGAPDYDRTSRNLSQNRQSEHAYFMDARIAKAISRPGASCRCDDMVHYTEWASEGLAHHFAVESDELTLKTNARCVPANVA